jgi:hypothetical protein
MFGDIIKIAILCVLLGGISIPMSFNINSSPWVVWFGNALGSLFSAWVVIYLSNRIVSDRFRVRIKKNPISKRIVIIFEEGKSNKQVAQAHGFIKKRGLKLFALVCPIFPGVLVSTAAVYLLGLDRKTYSRWMLPGVFFVSGLYVFGYWAVFVE